MTFEEWWQNRQITESHFYWDKVEAEKAWEAATLAERERILGEVSTALKALHGSRFGIAKLEAAKKEAWPECGKVQDERVKGA